MNSEGIVIVDCWATWCGPCKEFAPVFERVAARYPEHRFASIDTEGEPELVESLHVTHIPALMLYRDGVLLLQRPGYLDEAGLDDVIAQAAALDMAAVRAEIEADQAGDDTEDEAAG